ncbi:aspartyl-tRNA(Asn)/glutamyl-tRNA(Gln) amidotransferase subunit A [Mycobacterium frederiksbergense]|uniref:Aspartyl-tRNA(Asn)/glutamyl-tRNA(Gln) amidotransferase subunit A n=1 Tax=Mycolicibacterium frederiksbergense TaxID=117567 RepID=A0ABT6KSB5_9MYCO|nr:amidase family protein [Mycolicibacterium frederiksbergense]MDH6193633.1 aspartyl-tRNA(Asn)/glutamyl-tRNA(Gln) amidotransferase subunit A [Mycolicibacterium frederiksbergense]
MNTRSSAAESCQQSLTRAATPAARSALITTTAARAVREAELSDVRRRAGQARSELDGTPIVWKDLFDLNGNATTCGSALSAGGPAALSDSALVRRAGRLGLVTVGKTNLSEFAYSGLGINRHFGTPVNPIDPALVPGGSSSGSAVAVTAGIAPLAIGTDTSGSVRVPAAFCGCVGFRASPNRYGPNDFTPLSPTLDCVGILARTVASIRAFDRLLAVACKPRPDSGGPPRFVIPAGEWIDDCTPEVRAAFDATIEVLRGHGLSVSTRRVVALDAAKQMLDSHGTIVGAEAHERYGHLASAAGIEPATRRRLQSNAHVDITPLRVAMPTLRQQFSTELCGALLLCPTVRHEPPRIDALLASEAVYDAVNASTLRTTMALSYLGTCGISLPLNASGRPLPIGVLLSAPAGADAYLLAQAALVTRYTS